MGLRDLALKPAYDSDVDDVLDDFYIPALAEAIHYRRLAGFFTSRALAVAARGIRRFILGGGQMEMVVGPSLSEEDVEAIRAGTMDREAVIAASGIRELEDLSEAFVRDHVRALAWLVAQGRLTIKIAIPFDADGLPMDAKSIDEEGIYHHKVGVLKDEFGDELSFSGSINETARAWTKNRDSFHIFRSWEPAEAEHLRSDKDMVSRYIEGRASRTIVTDVPKSLERHLLQLAPHDISEIDLKQYERSRATVGDLHDYQAKAMDAWLYNPAGSPRRRGIIEMATGTGKTWVACACMQTLSKDKETEKLLTVIAVPFKHLIPQWREELRKWRFTDAEEAHGEVPGWDQVVADLSLRLRLGHRRWGIILTTHDTLTSDKFLEVMKGNQFPMLLVADEVHAVGSELRKDRLLENYTFRMGLSATPERYFDDAGTTALMDYFGGVVYQLPIEKAIDLGALVPYEYYPMTVELTPAEMEEYRKLTRKYAALAGADDQHSSELRERFLFERAKVVEAAAEKYQALSKVLDSIGSPNHCLIFITERQLVRTNEILDLRRIVRHDFLESETMAERTELLSRFAAGDYQALVAIRCLDEGVDVPGARQAIIMASTGNPRQFIQRRGRILRTAPGKEMAQVWDFIVVARKKPDPTSDYFNLERGILEKQLRRVQEFASISTNPRTTTLAIMDIKIAYRLT